MFARPGPRLVDALEFLVGLLHNRHDLIPADFPWTWWDTQSSASTSQSSSLQSANTTDAAYNSNHTAGDNCVVATASISGNDVQPNGIATERASTPNARSKHASAKPSPDVQQPESSKAAQQNGNSKVAQPGCDSKAAQQSGHSQAAQQDSKGNATPQNGGIKAAQLPAERKWKSAPFLSHEIEEAHAAAIEAGQPTYTDPATGYKVALWFHWSQGHIMGLLCFEALLGC